MKSLWQTLKDAFKEAMKPNLWWAAKAGNVQEIEQLVAAGHDVNSKKCPIGTEDSTPLHIAARAGKIDAIRTLMRLGARIDEKDREGRTPLIEAVIGHGREDVVQSIVELGANVDARDKSLMTALDWAASAGNVKLVELLLKFGAKPNVGHGNKRSSSIAQCINGGKLEILNLLVKAHADVNAPNGGRLPLSIAALEDRLDFVKGLLDAGADPNRQSCDGYTPLSCAIAAARFEIVEMLVKAGANVNSVNPETGETALDIAVDQKRVNRRDPAIAAYLRRAGAKHAKDLGSLPENQDSEVDWQLRHDAVLTATLEPWPPKQGSVCINVEVTTADEQTQIVESVGCRVATTQENSEDWKPMEMTGVEENGSVHFKYSVSMAKGASYIQFRVRDQVDRKPQDLTDWKVDVE